MDLYEGVTDLVEIIRILHGSKKYDELIRYSAPPETVDVFYGMLNESQRKAMADIAVEAMRTGDKSLAGEIGEALATLTDFSLDQMLEASLDLWHLWFIRRFGGISKCLTASGFTEAWLPCGLFRDSKRPLVENLGQGLTRRGRSGDQDIPWQVASPQSLPPLLLAVVLQLIDGSPDKSGTSE